MESALFCDERNRVEDLLFERLERMEARVPPEVVLQDLYFVDRVIRPLVGPEDVDYRVPYLVEALESRRFCPDAESCWGVIELYDDLCELCDVRSFEGLAEVLDRFRAYRATESTTVEDH